MTFKQYRMLLTIIFALGAGYLIFNKFSNRPHQINQKVNPETRPKSTIEVKQAKPKTGAVQNSAGKGKAVRQTSSMQKMLDKLAQCTSLNSSQFSKLNDVKDQIGLNKISDQDIVRNNLIFKIAGQEKRASLFPSENGKTWSLEFFDVDAEGLPIPIKQLKSKSYADALKLVYQSFSKEQIIADEVEAQVDARGLSGTAFLVNKSIVNLSLYNKEMDTHLECTETICSCVRSR